MLVIGLPNAGTFFFRNHLKDQYAVGTVELKVVQPFRQAHAPNH